MNATRAAPIVYVVDDDLAVRTSLKWLLESVGYEVRTFENGQAFIDNHRHLGERDGCVLLDVRMPAMGGFQVQEALQAGGHALPILFLSAHGDIPMTVRALKAGAFDFIEKPFNDQKLLDAVEEAIAQSPQARTQHRTVQEARRKLDALSPREREILDLMASGKSSKLIAIQLGISYKTVEVHRAHIREKVGANSLAELVQLAVESR